MGEKRNAYMILVGKPEGKRPLGRPRHRWEDIRIWSTATTFLSPLKAAILKLGSFRNLHTV
jgi:hypothetical protein